MVRAGVWLATLPLLAACGDDPILERAALAEEASSTSGATAPSAGPSPSGAPPRANIGDPQPVGEPGGPPKPGIPEEPMPGVPGSRQPVASGELRPGVPEEPKPGIPAEPTPGAPGSPQPFSGPRVKLTGELRYAAYKGGRVKITAFDGPHSARSRTPPKVVGNIELDRLGDFLLEVPQNVGEVYIEAVVDEDGDGRPGPLDPHGNAERYPVTVGERDVSGIVVELAAQAPPPSGTGKGDF